MRIALVTDLFGTDNFLTNIPADTLLFYLLPLLLLVGFGGVASLVYFILRRRSMATLYLKDPLFDGASRSFYGLVDVAVRDHFSLFRNIPVDEVIRHSGAVSPLSGKIRNGCFDLLLCDRRKMLPRCAIVLLEKGAQQTKETQLLRSYCDRVKLPFLVYETGGFFDVGRLRNDIYQATGLNNLLGTCAVLGDSRDSDGDEPSPAETLPEATEIKRDIHVCKKCGSEMILRTISKGKHAGCKAMVCETFPDCRYAVLSEAIAE